MSDAMNHFSGRIYNLNKIAPIGQKKGGRGASFKISCISATNPDETVLGICICDIIATRFICRMVYLDDGSCPEMLPKRMIFELNFGLPAGGAGIVVAKVPSPEVQVVLHYDELGPFIVLGGGIVVFGNDNFLSLYQKGRQKNKKKGGKFFQVVLHGYKAKK